MYPSMKNNALKISLYVNVSSYIDSYVLQRTNIFV